MFSSTMKVFCVLSGLLSSSLAFRLGDTVDNRIPTTCSTKTGSSCVFPFSYSGTTHYQCTYQDSPTPWCATATDSEGNVVTNSWGDCDTSSSSSCQTESLSLSSCTTDSGPTPNTACVFPFRYLGVVYTTCTSVGQAQDWCSTQTTEAGTHVEGQYGFCPSSCSTTTTTTTPTTSTSTTPTTTTTSSGTCTPGTSTTVDCNTCVCASDLSLVCTNNVCTTTTTTISTSTTTTVTTTTASSTPCTTMSGPAPVGTQCIFPFTFDDVTYNSCADWVYGGTEQGSTWCSTKVDSNGVHVNGEGNYGFCGSDCSTTSLLDLLEGILGGTVSTDTKFTRSSSKSQSGAIVFGGKSRVQQPL